MVKPDLNVGAKKTWQNKKGKEWDETLVAVDETTATYQSSGSCTRTTLHEEFSQSVKWNNCGGGSGKGTTSLDSGEIWPLTKGKKWRYKYAGSDNKGNRWRGKMRCSVKDEVRVSVPAGEFDTYHIVCKTKNITREYYNISRNQDERDVQAETSNGEEENHQAGVLHFGDVRVTVPTLHAGDRSPRQAHSQVDRAGRPIDCDENRVYCSVRKPFDDGGVRGRRGASGELCGFDLDGKEDSEGAALQEVRRRRARRRS